MSNTLTKRPYQQALAEAHAFRDLFPASSYDRWEIAGSIRRGRPEVGDVEHVVIPLFGDIQVDGGLFTETERVNLVWHFLDTLVRDRVVNKHLYGGNGPRWGDLQRGIDWRGFRHEFYTADADTWGAQLAIHTGPAELSQRLVTAIKRTVYVHGAGGFRVIDSRNGQAVPTPDEKTYFEIFGVAFCEPERRQ